MNSQKQKEKQTIVERKGNSQLPSSCIHRFNSLHTCIVDNDILTRDECYKETVNYFQCVTKQKHQYQIHNK